MTAKARDLVLAVPLALLLGLLSLGPPSSAQDNAADLAVKSDLRSIANQLETYYTNHQTYPGTRAVAYDGVRDVQIGRKVVKLGRGDRLGTIRLTSDRQSYCIRVKRSRGTIDTSRLWSYVSDRGGIVPGGCPARHTKKVA
jgi:type II secretory pathway pseudopilin PulG